MFAGPVPFAFLKLMDRMVRYVFASFRSLEGIFAMVWSMYNVSDASFITLFRSDSNPFSPYTLLNRSIAA